MIKTLCIAMIIIGFILMVYSGFDLMNGLHNMDIGYNLKILEARGDYMVDIGSDGIKRDSDEIYSLGFNQVKSNFKWLVSSFGMILIGVWNIRGE